VCPVLFLADAHLRGPEDPNQPALIEFLDRRAAPGCGLVILGDLFEYLAGANRAALAAYRPVLERLGRFDPLVYLEGNHDFDLAPSLPGLERAVLHTRPAAARLEGLRCQLLHGDRVDPLDIGTRVLRAALQSKLLRIARDRLLPDGLVFRVALQYARLSRGHSFPGPAHETQVLRSWARRIVAAGPIDAVIFGHTHQALLEPLPGGALANPGRALPGGSYLELTGRTLSLHRFPTGELLPPGPLTLPPPAPGPQSA
jgi:UDP-2,3-diacylglucosamine hydrolase